MIHLDYETKLLTALAVGAFAFGSIALAAAKPRTNFARLAAFAIGLALLYAGALYLFTDHKSSRPEVFRLLIGLFCGGLGVSSIWCAFTKSPEELHALMEKTRVR